MMRTGHKLSELAIADVRYTQSGLSSNPLVRRIRKVASRIAEFKNEARTYYFQVILSALSCPSCNGNLKMAGESQCMCSCGKVFDPTLAFQKSTCCGVGLNKKTFHYACSKCNKIVPSRFLFDEKVFDKEYFG